MKLASLEAIAVALRDAGARYLIVGGLAVAAHGYGRVTFDLDLVVQLQPDNLRRAMQALESLGYRPTLPVQTRQFADAESRDAWIRDKNMVVFQMHSDKHGDPGSDEGHGRPAQGPGRCQATETVAAGTRSWRMRTRRMPPPPGMSTTSRSCAIFAR